MRILIFSLAYLPFVGGAELAVKEITDRLPEFDFEMLTVNLDGRQKSEEKIGNVLVRRIGKGKISKYFFPFTAYRKARQLYSQNNYDAVWAIMANQAGLAALFFKLKFPKIKYLLTLQEGDSEFDIWLRTWFMRPLYKMIYRRADYIQAISSYLKQRAIKYGYRGKIEVVPNGVALANFSQFFTDEEKLKLRQQLGLQGDGRVLISASRLVKKNGLDILIKAIKNLKVKLIILGTGKEEGNLKALTQKLRLKNQVLFLGHVSHQELSKYLKIADIFVRPSRSEGLGSAFLEAMAAGLPVIGTPVGGIPDFLKDGETGLFCKIKDPADLAEKIKNLLINKDLRQKLIEKSEALVQNYQWDNISLKMKEILVNL